MASVNNIVGFFTFTKVIKVEFTTAGKCVYKVDVPVHLLALVTT